jgi:putative transposase
VGGEERGYDGGKKVKGRKRHILVDTEGFVLKAKVHSANVLDQVRITRRYLAKRASDSRAYLTCGWTRATAEKTRTQIGSRRPWAGAWSSWSVRKSSSRKRF